MCSYRRNRSL